MYSRLRLYTARNSYKSRTSDIADIMNVKINSLGLGPTRANLIKKGMIYSPSHGDMAFTVPLFDEFMQRAIPEFDAND